jgi:hypothetical protein
MVKTGNSTFICDPAESDEAAVDPEAIPDTMEDILKDVIHPERLSPSAIGKLSKFMQNRPGAETVTPEIRARIRTIINHLRPTPAELVNRWAFNFASEDPVAQNLTQNLVAQMLGLDKSTISRAVKKWREILHYNNRVSAKSQAMHLRARTLRHRREQRA